ncbi:hypothetical protein FBULB1_7406 [Fusarium bulbicola]|nr:hypothetical protein FBULB1_7406 [Fusarium bulbicola]
MVVVVFRVRAGHGNAKFRSFCLRAEKGIHESMSDRSVCDGGANLFIEEPFTSSLGEESTNNFASRHPHRDPSRGLQHTHYSCAMQAIHQTEVDPINIRINPIHFTFHSGVSDYDPAVPNRTFLYQSNEPKIFSLRADGNLVTNTTSDDTSACFQSILSQKDTREKHVNVMLDYFAVRIEDIVRESLENMDYDIATRHRMLRNAIIKLCSFRAN